MLLTRLRKLVKVLGLVYNLQSWYLLRGSLSGPQLHLLITPSHLSLCDVRLSNIMGILNADLREWLIEIGPFLRNLNLSGRPRR